MMQLMILTALAASIGADGTVLDENGLEQTKNGSFIFRKYPPRALAAGEQGDVLFRADYDSKGSVLSCQVIKSSGYKRLDDETCELIVKHARFKPAWLNNGKRVEGVLDGVVEWRIPGKAVLAMPNLAHKDGNLPDKIICKKIPRGGSMVIMSKQCLTEREWEFQSDEIRDTLGEAQRRASQRGPGN